MPRLFSATPGATRKTDHCDYALCPTCSKSVKFAKSYFSFCSKLQESHLPINQEPRETMGGTSRR